MKLSGTVIWMAGSAVVLVAALLVGLSVREIRTRKAKEELAAKAEKKPARKMPETGPMARRPDRQRSTQGNREQTQADREQERQRWQIMSDEERKKMMEERGERLRAGGGAEGGPGGGFGRGGGFGGRGGGQMPQMSEEDRARMQEMRDRYESMTEEERAQMREEMRSRMGGRRGGRGMRPDGGGGEPQPQQQESEATPQN